MNEYLIIYKIISERNILFSKTIKANNFTNAEKDFKGIASKTDIIIQIILTYSHKNF